MSEQSDQKLGRRDLLDGAIAVCAAATGAAIAYPALRMLQPVADARSGAVVVGKASDLASGSSVSALLDGSPILVVRTTEGELRAFSAICPHLGCIVRMEDGAEAVACACHGGRFALDGRNVGGPARRPLERLRVAVVDGAIVVSSV